MPFSFISHWFRRFSWGSGSHICWCLGWIALHLKMRLDQQTKNLKAYVTASFVTGCSRPFTEFFTSQGCKDGSSHTSWHTSRLAVTSRMLLCLIETNPPFLRDNACCSENVMPHSQNSGVLESCHPYRIRIRSQNNCLVRAYPSYFSSRVVNQAEAPGFWFKSFVRNCSKFMCELCEFYFWWFEFLHLVHTDASGW